MDDKNIKQLKHANVERIKITNTTRKEIRSMYLDLSKKIDKKAENLKSYSNISSTLQHQMLLDLKSEMSKEIDSLGRQIGNTIQSSCYETAKQVAEDGRKELDKMGFNMSGAFATVPTDAVNAVISGKLYKGKWDLSSAIWGDNKKTLKDINYVVSQGLALNKSTYEIAKDLSKYVNPKMRKDWDWSKVYPGTKKVVDYSAQRLARTMISHSYQQALVQTTYKNPFITAYKWLPSYEDRMCMLCQERGESDQYGLGAGVYPKDELPLDHPNGMCTVAIVELQNYNDIAKKLADWINDEGDEKLNRQIDRFTKDAYGDIIKSNLMKKTLVKTNFQYSKVPSELLNSNIKYNEIERRLVPLSDDKIIKRISGDDKMGSCSSLTYCYIAEKKGYKITDFRGDESLLYFGNESNNIKILNEASNGKVIVSNAKDSLNQALELLQKTNKNNMYRLSVGEHVSIIKKDKQNELYYLELQSVKYRGWKEMGNLSTNNLNELQKTIDVLQKRFGADFNYDTGDSSLINIKDIKMTNDFKKVLGYINTDIR